VSNFYSKKHEVTIMWNDQTLSVNWIIKQKEILNNKDKNGIFFNELKTPFYL
jgi:dTDP-4-dehydrorhamnose 3,5-epimerase-like enzyme